MKKVLFIAYHHPKNKSSQSAALVRRIGQYHQFFEKKNWEIDYIITQNEKQADVDFGQSRVLQVKLKEYFSNKLFNKIFTFFVLLVFGDFVGYSFFMKRKEISNFLREDYDLMISFFTPRGTIWLGNRIKNKMNMPWWVDVQDSLDEGLFKHNLKLGISWIKNKLKSADQIIHVSPEWKILDEARIKKKIIVQRHCIPDPPDKTHLSASIYNNEAKNKIKLFYGGNIHFQSMNPELLKPVFDRSNYCFYYAGYPTVYQELLNKGLSFIYLGMLDEERLINAYQNSDIIIIFAWNNSERQVIPSKFYEACAFDKPILIVGKDSGSFNGLFKEWGHPNVVLESNEDVSLALEKYSKGDFSSFFLASNCLNELSDRTQFSNFLNSLIDVSS